MMVLLLFLVYCKEIDDQRLPMYLFLSDIVAADDDDDDEVVVVLP